jgi:hypothetical protein
MAQDVRQFDRFSSRHDHRRSMSGIREFLNSGPGKVVSALLCLSAVGVAAVLIVRNLGGDPSIAANQRVFVDVSTGQPFGHDLTLGEEIPVLAPSGSRSGYPAERCYWTREGTPTDQPSFVVLNETMAKTGPTFCPDCDRLVVGHNPVASADRQPPPTRAQLSSKP